MVHQRCLLQGLRRPRDRLRQVVNRKREDRVLSKINTGGVLLAFYLSSAGNWVDANIVDGVANGFSSTGQSLSRAARRVQTGITEQYILIFSTGLVVLLILFVFATGAYRLL